MLFIRESDLLGRCALSLGTFAKSLDLFPKVWILFQSLLREEFLAVSW